jgi:lysyl endopeptidase
MKSIGNRISALGSMADCGRFVLFISALALFSPQPGLAREGVPPISFETRMAPLTMGNAVILPAVDEARFLAEDAQAVAAADKPLRFAAPIAVSFVPEADGSWVDLADGSRVWRLRVISPGAKSLNFALTGVSLPPGASLHFYPADEHLYDGPYAAADVTPERELWTAVIPGDDAVIELSIPPHPSFAATLTVSQVGHDYRGFVQVLNENLRQGSCNNDVVCPEGDPWRAEIRSEGVYSLGGSSICSGQMVNSNDPAHPPYFLTANHCGISSGNAGSLVVYWRFESPQCGNLCCGPLTYHQNGSTLKARYSNSDFCLVRLNQNPATDSQVYYSGWDATTTNAPASAVGIHHPNCDEKAISFTNVALAVTGYLNNSTPGDGTHWRINHWDDGTTEPGSSGSGLWDPNHRLVGQLHGGYASCSSITSDWYGRVAISWDGGGSAASRLKDWLDPSGSGPLAINGWDPLAPSAVGAASTTGSSLPFSITPNPASADFVVRLDLPRAGLISVDVMDAGGRMAGSRETASMAAGVSELQWSRGQGGGALAPGVYFVRVSLDGRSIGTHKLLIVR